MHNYLFMIGMIMYGIGRATQQALIFMHRDEQNIPEWIDEAGEIHLFGLIETLSLILAVFSMSYYVYNYSFWHVLNIFPAYCIYYLPYALLFNKMRGREWFLPNQEYRFTIFGRELRFKLPSRLAATIIFVAAGLYSLFILGA